PAELPGGAERREVAAEAREGTVAAVELDRVVKVDRDRERRADADVLQPLPPLAIDRRAPASVIGGVHGRPPAHTHVVDRVSLHAVEGLPLEPLAAEEVVVVRV